MLRKTTDLARFKLRARDGDIGRVKDIYFDDANWAIRHIVADTGTWLTGRQVLLSPFAVQAIDDADQVVGIDLTRKQIEDSPPIEADKPVSAQMERHYFEYYGWPYYWDGPFLWGPYPYPRTYAPPPVFDPPADVPRREKGDPHLRSVNAVRRYHIQALDQEFGHLEDFFFSDDNWVIRHILIDTRNWWPGKKVLLPREWISSIDWTHSQIHIDLDRETVKRAPEYQTDQPLTRAYEEQLYRFFNRRPYWQSEQNPASRMA